MSAHQTGLERVTALPNPEILRQPISKYHAIIFTELNVPPKRCPPQKIKYVSYHKTSSSRCAYTTTASALNAQPIYHQSPPHISPLLSKTSADGSEAESICPRAGDGGIVDRALVIFRLPPAVTGAVPTHVGLEGPELVTSTTRPKYRDVAN